MNIRDVSDYSFLVYSPNESASNAGNGFWTKKGWGDIEDAITYSVEDISIFPLPNSVGNDARFVLLNWLIAASGNTIFSARNLDQQAELALSRGFEDIYRVSPFDPAFTIPGDLVIGPLPISMQHILFSKGVNYVELTDTVNGIAIKSCSFVHYNDLVSKIKQIIPLAEKTGSGSDPIYDRIANQYLDALYSKKSK